jgi:hypothetical protein
VAPARVIEVVVGEGFRPFREKLDELTIGQVRRHKRIGKIGDAKQTFVEQSWTFSNHASGKVS